MPAKPEPKTKPEKPAKPKPTSSLTRPIESGSIWLTMNGSLVYACDQDDDGDWNFRVIKGGHGIENMAGMDITNDDFILGPDGKFWELKGEVMDDDMTPQEREACAKLDLYLRIL